MVIWYRAKRPTWLWRVFSPYGKATQQFVSRNGLNIRHGPFKGLLFPERSLGHTNYLGSKLVGTYEPPVVDFVATEATGKDLFVDLGSGDGYFLVGVGREKPDLRLIGYELNKYERDLASEIADLNGLSIENRPEASIEELNSLPEGELLLLCDLEGLEADFLDPERVPRLKFATIIAEVHEQFRPGVTQLLTERFSDTHEVVHLPATDADPSEIGELDDWDPKLAKIVVHDGHFAGNGWLTFVPRS